MQLQTVMVSQFYVMLNTFAGKVTQWMIRKGFESVDLMKLKRIGKKTTPEQQQTQPAQGEGDAAKAGQKLRGEAFISRFAGKSCFKQDRS